MKVSRFSAVLLGGALLFSASAFASNTNKKSLHLYENVTVQGTQLAPGNYKVEWSGNGPMVKISILKDNNVVATAPAKIVSQAESNGQDGYGLKPGKDGTQTLSQVFFSGEKYDLNINPAAASSSSQGASSTGAN